MLGSVFYFITPVQKLESLPPKTRQIYPDFGPNLTFVGFLAILFFYL